MYYTSSLCVLEIYYLNFMWKAQTKGYFQNY